MADKIYATHVTEYSKKILPIYYRFFSELVLYFKSEETYSANYSS